MGKFYVFDAQHRRARIQNRRERNDPTITQIRRYQKFDITMLY